MKWFLAAAVTIVALAALRLPAGGRAAPLDAELQPRGIGEQLRYIGRDQMTGMPAPVDDRFIATVERAVERYGKDESAPVPPPPADGVDVASLAIPRLGVNATVKRFGVDRFGRLDVPQDSRTIGWNPAFSDLPGRGGESFFAAHFEYQGVAGVFFQLSTLAPGDAVTVTLSDGNAQVYRVTSTVDYPLGVIDMGALLFGREGVEGITLMTCSGPANEGEFPLRTVVLAELVPG